MRPEQNQSATHYVHKLSYSARERLVGVFVLVALLFLLALVGVNEKTLHFFAKKTEFHTYFSTAKGLSTDTPIKMLGLEVGKVTSLSLSADHRIRANIGVYDQYRHMVRADSRARLNRLGRIGGATIELSAGSMEYPPLVDGAFLPAEETPSLDELVEGFADLVMMGEADSARTLLTDLSGVIHNLKHITDTVRAGDGTLGTLIYGDEFRDNIRVTVLRVSQLTQELSEIVAEAKPLLSDTRGIVGNIRDATGELPEMMVKSGQAIEKVDSVLTTLNSELHQFPDLLVRLNLTLEEANRVLEAMQRVWPLSSAVRQRDEDRLIGVQPIDE